MHLYAMSPVDLVAARKLAEDHNITNALYVEIYTAIIDVLKKFDGKQINKKIETALKNDPRLKGYHISYTIHAGMYHITFWGNKLDYEHRNHVFLGYVSEGNTLNLDNVKKNNHGFLTGSIIDLTTLDERINKWNCLVSSLISLYKGPCDDITFILNK